MRLNGALVPSFLFISAVLADPHRGRQQPPFLNRVEKSIDPTIVFPYDHDQWAGAVWRTTQRFIRSTAGTFTVPDAYSTSSLKGFNIVVAIGAYDEERAPCGPAVGITVWANGTGGANYEAWGQWYPDDVQRAPDSFSIKPGHQIRATVHKYSLYSGFVTLMNLNTKTVWATWVYGGRFCINHWDADWIVTTIPSKDQVKVANFGEVSFTDTVVDTSGHPRVPDRTGEISTLNITQNNRLGVKASLMVYEAFIVIEYIPDGYIILPYDHDQWAGAVWRTTLGSIKSAGGTFTVPSAYSASSPKGFNIVVTIGGYPHVPCGPVVGITVWANGTGGADYEAWGQWYPDDIQRAPDSFSIKPGHQIAAFVQIYSSKSGFVLLMNLTTKTVWWAWVYGYLSCSHQWDADWVVTTIPSEDQVEVPDFGAVSFTDIIVNTSGTPKVPDHTGEIITLNITQHNQVVTSVIVYEAFVIIRYRDN